MMSTRQRASAEPQSDLERWFDAGLLSGVSADRAVDLEGWPRPAEAHLSDDGNVCFRPALEASERRLVRPRAGLLDDFLELSDLDDAAVLRYARKNGPLGICREHGRLLTHGEGVQWLDSDASRWRPFEPCAPDERDGWVCEPIEAWREYSGLARSMLDAGAALLTSGARSVEGGKLRADLPRVLRPWLSTVGVSFSWKDRAQLRLRVSGLAGALGLQIALACAREPGIAVCSSCGRPYVPARRVRADRANYCQRAECRDGARQRAASRRYAEKRRDGAKPTGRATTQEGSNDEQARER